MHNITLLCLDREWKGMNQLKKENEVTIIPFHFQNK